MIKTGNDSTVQRFNNLRSGDWRPGTEDSLAYWHIITLAHFDCLLSFILQKPQPLPPCPRYFGITKVGHYLRQHFGILYGNGQRLRRDRFPVKLTKTTNLTEQLHRHVSFRLSAHSAACRKILHRHFHRERKSAGCFLRCVIRQTVVEQQILCAVNRNITIACRHQVLRICIEGQHILRKAFIYRHHHYGYLQPE